MRRIFGRAVPVAAVVALVGAVACDPRDEPAGANKVAPPGAAAAAPPEAAAAFAAGFPTSTVPADIPGGAPKASLVAASVFAWEEFTALNWPAVGAPRDTPDTTKLFGQPGYTGPLVWNTYRHKVEIYPGVGNPNGYDPKAPDLGYSAPSQYVYNPTNVGTYPTLPAGQVPAADPAQAGDAPPWVNLDEISQIGIDTIYAGASPAGPFPGRQLLFMAGANKTEYTYIASKQWFDGKAAPLNTIIANTAKFVATNKADPPAGSATFVSMPNGTIEVKSGWRLLNPAEAKSGRFYTTKVRFYQNQDPAKTYNGAKGNPAYPCYVDQPLGLVGLHILQKTPTAPFWIWTTFEQADNILDAAGKPVEDDDGKYVGNPAATPFTPNIVTTNATPTTPQSFAPLTANCGAGPQLFFSNLSVPPGLTQGAVCSNRRQHPIPDPVVAVNKAAHDAIRAYNQANKIPSSPWLHYKLINVQWVPMTKPAPGQDFPGPAAATYYLSNSVVETDATLQTYSGISNPFPLLSDFDTNYSAKPVEPGQPVVNTLSGGQGFNMGGCMGCHGGAQAGGTDFSFIFGNRVSNPDVATPPPGSPAAAPAGTPVPAAAPAGTIPLPPAAAISKRFQLLRKGR